MEGLGWWHRDRNPARVWAARTAPSCWERTGKFLGGKSSSSNLRLCPAPGCDPRDREHPEPWRGLCPCLPSLQELLHPARCAPGPLAASSGVCWGSSALCSGTGRTETPPGPGGATHPQPRPGVAFPRCHLHCHLRLSLAPGRAASSARQFSVLGFESLIISKGNRQGRCPPAGDSGSWGHRGHPAASTALAPPGAGHSLGSGAGWRSWDSSATPARPHAAPSGV